MFCDFSEVMAQDDTVTFEKKTRLSFSFYLCLRLTSLNYAFTKKSSNTKVIIHRYDIKGDDQIYLKPFYG